MAPTLITLLVAFQGAFAANATQFQATIHPQAKAYDGRTFDHHFSLSAELYVEPKTTAQASARVMELCDSGDDSFPRECRKVCEVSLRTTIGYGKATSLNLEDGRAEVLSRPLVAYGTAYGAAEGCSLASAKLESVSIEHLLFSFGRVDLQLFHSWAAPLAEITLVSRDNGVYELSSAPASSNLEAFWSYRESESWSVDGPLKMERAK